MTKRKQAKALKNVLHHEREHLLDLDIFRADTLKTAARAWVGRGSGITRKDEALRILKQAFRSGDAKPVLDRMTDQERLVLGIVARYGERVSGCLLGAELNARGIANKRGNSWNRPKGVVENLEDKMFLIQDGDYWESPSRQPSVTLPRSLARIVTPADPLPWPAGSIDTAPNVKSSGYRSSAEVQLDLWAVCDALDQEGNWKPLKGGALPKSIRNRLKKKIGLPRAEDDDLHPPDPESLYYELMCGMGLAFADEYEAFVQESSDQRDQEARALIWRMTHAWMRRRLWQDGIGVVPDRDNDYEPVRIRPDEIERARLLLSWGLQRLAHTPDTDWVELEQFLTLLYHATEKVGFGFYWEVFTWNPGFKLAENRRDIVGKQRQLAFWLAQEGKWAANALMVTLYTLGLIERGTFKKAHYFRLTSLGRSVFGAPEIRHGVDQGDRKFLVVQPNFDVTVYLREMDGRDLQRITPFLTKVSQTGGQVQGFKLERDRVYQALEQGYRIEDIQDRLAEHSRESIPPVVKRALSEWSGKRESLTLRRKVGIVFSDAGEPSKTLKPRQMTTGCWLVKSAKAPLARAYPTGECIDHANCPSPLAEVTEDGVITFGENTILDSISKARLTTIAKPAAGSAAWKVSAQSIAAAAKLGIPGDRSVAWLSAMLKAASPPPLLAAAIRQWTKAPRSFFGRLDAIQIADPNVFRAVCHSEAFADVIAGVISPQWVLFDSAQAKEVKKRLLAYGFNLAGVPKLEAPQSVAAPDLGIESDNTPRVSVTVRKQAKRKTTRKRSSRRR